MAAQSQKAPHALGLGQEYQYEEGTGQGEQAQQLETVVAAPHLHALSAQLALAEAAGALNLPATGVDPHDPEGIRRALDWLVREQPPGLGPAAAARDDQLPGVRRPRSVGQPDRDSGAGARAPVPTPEEGKR